MLFIGCGLLLAISACIVPKERPAEFTTPELKKTAIAQLTVLQVADLRLDKSVNGNFNKWTHNRAKFFLKRKKYAFKIDNEPQHIKGISRELMQKASETENYTEVINVVKAANSEWVLLFTLNEFKSKFVFNCKASAEMKGYLFNTKSNQLVMRHTGVGEDSQGPLVCPIAAQTAIELAAIEILLRLPNK
ncbi:MAG: hypothetical protein IT260_01720 [Saprospiraceae bacterium]|nr:hypothetical protein [Saprospiraceae bacterium]